MKLLRKPNVVKKTAPVKRSLTLDDLPPRHTMRWNNKRKAIVVAAVESGLISLWDACDRYLLSVDEYLTWKRANNWTAAFTQGAPRAKPHRQSRFKLAA